MSCKFSTHRLYPNRSPLLDMPVAVPQLGSYQYVPETKVCLEQCAQILLMMTVTHAGKPGLGGLSHR